jgi:acyl-coenzyme A thioesterase PaaI-like protein
VTEPGSERFVDPDGGGSVRRYLGLDRSEVPDGDGGWMLIGRAPIGERLRGPTGELRTGALAAMVDSVGGFAGGLATLPDWVVTTSILLRVGRPPALGPVRLEPRVLRRGRNAVVTEVRVFDDGDTHAGAVASSVISCAVLTPESGPPQLTRPVRIPPPEPFAAPEPYERFLGLDEEGGSTDATGVSTRLELKPPLRNRWGILHGGVVAALVDVAAVRAAGGGVSTDLVLHFLSPAKIGPVEATSEVIGTRVDGTLVHVAVCDTGADGRRVATASVTVRPR